MGLAPPSAPGDLASLLARIEALSGPDREVDALLTVHFDVRPDWCVGYGDLWIDPKTKLGEPVIRINNLANRKPSSGNPPMGPYERYTASLDSALALVERLNPAFCWRVQKSGDIARKMGEGPFWATCGLAGEQEAAHAQTASLALLAALIKSLQHAD